MIFIEYARFLWSKITQKSFLIHTFMLTDLQKKILRKPHVNSTCIGCSACVSISSQVFELDDQWLSCVKHCETYEWQDVDDSIAACPVNAISWQNVDENGAYLDWLQEHQDAT